MPTTLACYLLREDGEWYALGNTHRWRLAFAVFPGEPDGSTILELEDAYALSLRLDDYDHSEPERIAIAVDIIEWSHGKSFRFVSELDPEVEPGVLPAPITGTAATAATCLRG